MIDDYPHLLLGIREEAPEAVRDGGMALAHLCREHLPGHVRAEAVPPDATPEWPVFRHSAAPYWPGFDPEAPRRLLRLSLPFVEPDAQARLRLAADLAGHALTLGDHLPVDAVCWPYAQLLSELRQMRAAMERLRSGQDAPVLQFVRMTVHPDGTLTSTGLYFFCGQEIRMRATRDMAPAGLVRRASRIAADAMLNGPYARAVETAGLVPGEAITIRPERRVPRLREPQWLTVCCDLRSVTLSGMDL